VLREAFDYPYAQIADILRATEPSVRQLVSRARKHVTGERRAPVSADAQKELLSAFIAAARSGEMGALEKLFAADSQVLGSIEANVRQLSRRARARLCGDRGRQASPVGQPSLLGRSKVAPGVLSGLRW
jgi:RNA polymerase sigma-70 factor (ECF subfamily)